MERKLFIDRYRFIIYNIISSVLHSIQLITHALLYAYFGNCFNNDLLLRLALAQTAQLERNNAALRETLAIETLVQCKAQIGEKRLATDLETLQQREVMQWISAHSVSGNVRDQTTMCDKKDQSAETQVVKS